MRDELEAPFLDEWLHETEVTPPDPAEGARRVASQLPHTRQVGRWLPFSLFRREAQPPAATATDTAEYQPSPIPASNGHTPTVIGRTQSMLSPVKAITAGALVFAIGGAFLIAQPFGQQSADVPGAESGAAGEGAWVSATVEFGSDCDFGDFALEGDVKQERGMNCRGQTWTSDDPRLDGIAYVAHNADSFTVDGQSYSLVTSAIVAFNDAGGWQCTNGDRVVSPSATLFETALLGGDRLSCVGYGDNEGLSAVLVADFTSSPMTVEGLIFPGEMPPMPEFPAVE